ncbi:MAG TPA: cupin-like domain-containing protein [Steroidobacteraceae bacterium]|nr:cupin-like domain-containing protein [Steroidobacteraceae bacterium]
MSETAQILIRHGVDLKTFDAEIRPAAQPVVLKDLVSDWPVVRAARESRRALADCLRGFDRGRPVTVVERPAGSSGHLFYRPDMSGFNFTRAPGQIGATLDRLLAIADQPEADAPTIFLESMPTAEFLPDFAAAHPMPFVPRDAGPRVWIGNRVKVQTHFDLLYNIACVVGGRRRFTLFPPEQMPNLYPGPIDFTPSGTPLSMVPFVAPDAAQFPRYAEALRHARSAELEPGDALYIPYGWWHHVESLTPFNVLVNYWWNDAPPLGSPYSVLLHAALTLRDLPADQRAVWSGIFAHLVFTDPEQSMRHLPPAQRGLLSPPSARRIQEVRRILAQTFAGKP